jgi:hypothetical protein
MSNVDVADPHRNFTSNEWESLVLVVALMFFGCAMLWLAVAAAAMLVVKAWWLDDRVLMIKGPQARRHRRPLQIQTTML